MEDEVKKFKQKNIGKKFVIVVGTYLVGKERLWSHIAQTFNMKVWIEAERRKAFDLIYSEENANPVITGSICDVREDAQLHIVPMQCIKYPVGLVFHIVGCTVDHFENYICFSF